MSKFNKKSFSSQEATDLFKNVIDDIYSTQREYKTIKELFLNKKEFVSFRYFSPILEEADMPQPNSKTLIYFKIIENQLYIINFAPELNIEIPLLFSKEIKENKIGIFKLEKELLNIQSKTMVEKLIEDKLMTIEIPIQVKAFSISMQNSFNSIEEYKTQYIASKALNQNIIPDILEKNVYKKSLNKNLNAYNLEENELINLENLFFQKWLKTLINQSNDFTFKDSDVILNYSILKLVNRLKNKDYYKLNL